ncbi:Putative ribosomal protein S23/S29 [Septoria linicola]|uniref:Small ribosomal subunit protein mS29 n=1 Tax=Septoria linicola TaxID=215465 RepID=A0A9Q9B5G4_9PEZI|nr:putative ribosomal protein S23/S29 [Septoria linicola]USW57717.1 Putative ribosomal protein S23/S29 [Septoria linicola]
MSSSQSMCLRCLRRSIQGIDSAPNASQRAAFSTSPSLAANPPKKKGAVAKPASRQGTTLRLSKNKRAATARPPAVGERRQLRKKVVLSNTNALEVQGLPDLSPGRAKSVALREVEGAVVGLQNDTVDALRALEAFKPTQGWSLFRRPATLVRKETIEMAGDVDWIAEAPKEGRAVRKVLYGARGSGKSVLQLQTLAMASLNKWIVVHVPEAKDLTNAHTAYEPIDTDKGTRYIQPTYTAKLLDNIAKANSALLQKLTVKQQHNIGVSIPNTTTLERLALIGAQDPDLAWPVWQALWSELLLKDADRPSVLFSLDGFDHIMRDSAYLNAETQPIHAHELTLVKHFIDLLSGRTPLPNGGMVLAAVSQSNRATALTLDACLERNNITQAEKKPRAWDPYVAHDKWVQEAMETVGVRKLEGLSKVEAKGVMEYYARSGMLRASVTDSLVSETWTLAGGGIIGQLENGSLRARF